MGSTGRVLFLVSALLLGSVGCHVRVQPGPGVEVDWHYYPAYDIYWSSAYGWSYWDGTAWVVVKTRPSWITIAPSAPWVVVRGGPRVYRRWDHHRSYRRATRPHPRVYRRPAARPARPAPRRAPARRPRHRR